MKNSLSFYASNRCQNEEPFPTLYEKRVVFLVVLSMLQFTTTGQSNHETSIHPSSQDTLYDIERYQKTVVTEDSTWTENGERKIPKKRVIFSKGRVHTYNATYLNPEGEVLSSNRIKVVSTGERWEGQPEKQDRIVYEFPDYTKDSIELWDHAINLELQNWTGSQSEGVIENAEQVWMHPIRVNQYKFTQVAPYPDVRLPLEKGKKWESSAHIFNGWGEWNHFRTSSEYEVLGKTTYELNSTKIDCWVVESTLKSSIGKSALTTLFNEKYGFVKMVYRNYEDEELIFELIEVKD